VNDQHHILNDWTEMAPDTYLFFFNFCSLIVKKGNSMNLSHDDIKRIVGAISKSKTAVDLTTVVGSKSVGGTNRYFFCVKSGGGSWAMLVAEQVIGWLGNVAQGAAGAGATGAGAAGGAIAGASGKAAALKGLSGAYGKGVIANASDTGDETKNNNYMHQLQASNGIQMIGFMDCSGSTVMKLWYGDPSWWSWFLKQLDSEEITDTSGTACTVLKGQRVITVNKVSLAY
jgi:hypothetical protein